MTYRDLILGNSLISGILLNPPEMHSSAMIPPSVMFVQLQLLRLQSMGMAAVAVAL